MMADCRRTICSPFHPFHPFRCDYGDGPDGDDYDDCDGNENGNENADDQIGDARCDLIGFDGDGQNVSDRNMNGDPHRLRLHDRDGNGGANDGVRDVHGIDSMEGRDVSMYSDVDGLDLQHSMDSVD